MLLTEAPADRLAAGPRVSESGCAFLRSFRQALLQSLKRGSRIVCKPEKIEVFAADRSMAHQRFEVDDLLPVTGAVQHHRNRTIQLLGLLQSQNLEHLVQGAEAPGEYHEGSRQVCEPEFAHEEVMKLQRQFGRNVGVGPLLMRQSDVEADGPSASLGSAAIGRLHDPAAAPGANNVSMGAGGQVYRPCGDKPRQLARLFVVAPQRALGGNSRRAEEHNGVVNPLAAENLPWLEVFGQDAQRAGLVAVEKLLVFVG